MRMDREGTKITAADVVNTMDEHNLANIIWQVCMRFIGIIILLHYPLIRVLYSMEKRGVQGILQEE